MGFHVVLPGQPGYERDVPCIEIDGGTTSWRDAKKLLRKWYLDEAAKLRKLSEKSYFEETL